MHCMPCSPGGNPRKPPRPGRIRRLGPGDDDDDRNAPRSPCSRLRKSLGGGYYMSSMSLADERRMAALIKREREAELNALR